MRTPEIEYRPAAEIKAFQERRLRETIAYIARHSAFYARMFAQQGIDPATICTLEDLQRLPFTSKEDLQRYNDDFLCVPRTRIADYITTSGTLSTPVTFAASDADLDRLAYNEKISFECAGVKAGDTVQLMVTLDKRFMAGLAYFLGIRSLGAGAIRVGNGIPELQWDTISRVKPDTIVCVPSFIMKIIDYAEQHGIDYRRSSIRKAICIGESLREQDFSLNLMSRRIKEKWDIDLYSTYASTEMATSFCECEYGCGGHHHPELIICEVVDDEGRTVEGDEAGELVVTTLGVEAMPLLRFRTGDMVRFHREPCRCGRTTMRVSPLVGRKNHMIKYKGTTLYPQSIYDTLNSVPYVDLYRIVLSDNDLGNDHILIRAAVGKAVAMSEAEIIKDLKDRFRARVRVAPDIEIVGESEVLRREIYPETSRKPILLTDNRKHKS